MGREHAQGYLSKKIRSGLIQKSEVGGEKRRCKVNDSQIFFFHLEGILRRVQATACDTKVATATLEVVSCKL